MTRNRKKAKRIRVYATLATVAVLAIALGVLLGGKISGILFSGQDLFLDQNKLAEATPTSIPVTLPPVEQQLTIAPQTETPLPETPVPTATPGPTPTLDPYAELEQVADTGMMNGIVNIMFIGVDYEAARIDKKWAGKDGNSFHSDVMIVCAVNFNENRVDLISLPRDTYASIPEVKGVYKLNAALNCGTDGTNYGLFCENGEGFEKVCEAAEWMLGGINVDYYFAVTMESVKQIVDIVGGVWYNLEGDFDNGGRYYKAGFQFMDGQACLDYMRVRKAGHGQLPTGDSNRVNRQKNMMVTIFRKMKEENLVLKVPEIISAFDGALFTNCTPAQTAALALFGYKLDPDNIGAHSMGGDGATLFHWNFVFTRQSDRVKLIKEIYGVDVKTMPKYSLAYGRYSWCKMLQDQYLDICDPLKTYAQKKLDEDDLQAGSSQGEDGESSGSTSRYSTADRELLSEYKSALKELKNLYSSADSEAKKAANRKSNSLNSVSNALLDQMIKVQDLAISVAHTFEYTKVKNISKTCYPNQTHTSSPWALNFWDKKKYNAVRVNFN